MSQRDYIFESAHLLDGAGGSKRLNDAQALQRDNIGEVLWLDIDLLNEKAQDWVTSKDVVEGSIADILLAGDTRPRSISIGDGLAVTLRGINMNPGAVPDDMVAVRIWLEDSRVITSHRRDLMSIDDLRDTLDRRKGPRTSGEFLVAIVDCLSERIGTAVDNIIQLIESVESGISGGDTSDLRTTLSVVRRQAAAIRRYLAPQREALDRLVRTSHPLFTAHELLLLREEGDVLTRHLEDLELAREQALVAQEELMNRYAQEQNSRMYLLSVVAAIFLPLTFMTGIFGMNVAGLPGTDNPDGFIYATGIMMLSGVALALFFKWKKWI